MKKTIVILMAAMLMISSAAPAEDLPALSDADLLVLYRRVTIELESRGIDARAVYPDDVYPGADLWDKDMADRLELFFGFWNSSDIPDMLTVCSFGWKAGRENPGADLSMLLGKRTPADYEIVSVSMEPADSVRNVSLIAWMDKNDGNDPVKYSLRISMTREADGLWYADPDSLEIFEHTAGGSDAEPVPGSAE